MGAEIPVTSLRAEIQVTQTPGHPFHPSFSRGTPLRSRAKDVMDPALQCRRLAVRVFRVILKWGM